jgi:hypothetical protein
MASKNADDKLPLISRVDFLSMAPAGLKVTIGGQDKVATRLEMSTGSYGYNLTDKVTVMVTDSETGEERAVTMQVGLNLTVVNSKNDPRTPATEAALKAKAAAKAKAPAKVAK